MEIRLPALSRRAAGQSRTSVTMAKAVGDPVGLPPKGAEIGNTQDDGISFANCRSLELRNVARCGDRSMERAASEIPPPRRYAKASPQGAAQLPTA